MFNGSIEGNQDGASNFMGFSYNEPNNVKACEMQEGKS